MIDNGGAIMTAQESLEGLWSLMFALDLQGYRQLASRTVVCKQ